MKEQIENCANCEFSALLIMDTMIPAIFCKKNHKIDAYQELPKSRRGLESAPKPGDCPGYEKMVTPKMFVSLDDVMNQSMKT